MSVAPLLWSRFLLSVRMQILVSTQCLGFPSIQPAHGGHIYGMYHGKVRYVLRKHLGPKLELYLLSPRPSDV
jgi:hypothetical protein